jgi:hypothetical protein
MGLRIVSIPCRHDLAAVAAPAAACCHCSQFPNLIPTAASDPVPEAIPAAARALAAAFLGRRCRTWSPGKGFRALDGQGNIIQSSRVKGFCGNILGSPASTA